MIIKNLKIKNLKYLKGQELPFGLVTSGLILNLDGFYSSSLANGKNTWDDLTSNNYDGTLYNGASYTTDKGGGVEFDGLDDTVDLGNILNGVIAGTSPTYTVQTWIKFDGPFVDDVLYTWFSKYGSGSNRQLFISVRNVTAESYGGIRIEHTPYTSPGLISGLPQARIIRSDGDIIVPNKIYNLTVCFDGSINTNDGLDRPTFYIDGVLQGNVFVLGFGPLTNTFQTTTMKVALNGSIGSGTTVQLFPYAGTNYQTLVYDRVLTQEEVTQNFNSLNGRYDVT